MEERFITVPYVDFVDGVQAMADLDSIRALVLNGNEYCSAGVLAILGLDAEDEETDGAD